MTSWDYQFQGSREDNESSHVCGGQRDQGLGPGHACAGMFQVYLKPRALTSFWFSHKPRQHELRLKIAEFMLLRSKIPCYLITVKSLSMLLMKARHPIRLLKVV